MVEDERERRVWQLGRFEYEPRFETQRCQRSSRMCVPPRMFSLCQPGRLVESAGLGLL